MGVSLFDILRKQDEERENVKAVENGESYSAASNATAEPAANTELSSSEKNDETKENEFLSDGEAESFGSSTVENSNSTATETSENPFESFGSEFSEMPETTEMPKDFGGDAPAEAVYYRDHVVPAMNELRAVADEMEILVAKKYWPFPTYGDILFSVQ